MSETVNAGARDAEWANNLLKGLVQDALRRPFGKELESVDLVFDTKEGFDAFMKLVDVRDGKCLARHAAQIAITSIDPTTAGHLQIHYSRHGRNTHVLSARYRPVP